MKYFDFESAKLRSFEYIVIPNGTDLDCNINPSVYIEDIFFEKINCRQLFTNIVFMIESRI